MREALFIKKNKDRWNRIQHEPSTDPDETASDFVHLVEDLSYAKTFYPYSKVTKHLNAQAAKIYLSIYQNRKEETNRISWLFKYSLPLTIRKHHKVFLFCLLVFIIFYAIGFFTAIKDESFIRDVLGSYYIQKTEENIKEGNPFGIYQTGNSFLMWLGIMINNIWVAITYFVEGIVLCVFTLMGLIQTAMMVGAFDVLFYKNGLGGEFILAVFIHGTLELAAIVVAGSAGVVLGMSWLFPGTLSRLQALKQGAKEGVKIMLAVIPVLMIAAFFEGFVTRHYRSMPLALNIFILVASLIFLIWYFVIFPIRVERKLLLEMNRNKLNEE